MEASFQVYEQADVNPGKVTPLPKIPQIALKKFLPPPATVNEQSEIRWYLCVGLLWH